MNITIRKANEKDFSYIFSLIQELAEFEKAPEKVTNSVDQMLEEKDYIQCFVAETETKEIIGIAQYFFAYFTWSGKSLYLGDLYVKESYRGNKVGLKLLNKIFEVAKEEKCKRITWQVLNWNTPAINFYKAIGVEIDKEWFNCNLYAKDIQKINLQLV
ncbi:MAG: GNAT family N-acetyltransferase [Ignavibacteriaceae bacterium]